MACTWSGEGEPVTRDRATKATSFDSSTILAYSPRETFSDMVSDAGAESSDLARLARCTSSGLGAGMVVVKIDGSRSYLNEEEARLAKRFKCEMWLQS